MHIQIPKGTFDVLPYGAEEPWRLSVFWQYVEQIARQTAAEYGYQEIRTPIYEKTDLFDRGVGETSDIVTKEMFTFQDKGGRSMSLRPEGTSAVMRSFIEHRLATLGSIHKFFYIGPMFRYERPQGGRYRQHHQFGVEAIGAADPEQDAEVIDLLLEVYKRLGLKNLKVHLNSVGDSASRIAFRTALVEYLRPFFASLSSDSQTRFEKNPLRILDSKDPKDQEILQNAPSILDSLSVDAKHHFEKLSRALDLIEIPYVINEKIVRGLDYYNKTVFEVISEDLGAQSTIGAGGRFDGLLKTFGGPNLPAVGFATGLERVLQTMLAQGIDPPEAAHPFVYFIPLDTEAKALCFSFATQCRRRRISADIELSTHKIQAGIQNAVRSKAVYAAVMGSDELKNQQVSLKRLDTRETKIISLDALLEFLERAFPHA